MIVVEVYNDRGILLDIINNVTDPGAVLDTSFDWEKLGGIISGELIVSPNYVYALSVNAEIVIRWSDEVNVASSETDFMPYSIAGYITEVPEFKVNQLVRIRFSGYWGKLNNICAVPTYTVPGSDPPEIRNGYLSETLKNILLDLFERNIKETVLVSSDGIIQRNKFLVNTTNFKITVAPGNNILSTVTLAFQDGMTATQIGTQLIAGQTYYLTYTVGTNTLTYVGVANYPITNSLSQSVAGISNAPETLVTNFVLEDMELSKVIETLVGMANIDYHVEQWTAYVDSDRVLRFEKLLLQEYLHEGTDFHNPDVTQENPKINAISLYTKDKDNSERTVFRGYVQNTDSISKYGIKSKSLVFTLEEGTQSELTLDNETAIIYMAKMLISKNSVPQTSIEIGRIQRVLPQGMYSITTQQVVGQKTVMEGDTLEFPGTNSNIPGQWNMVDMTNTSISRTRDKYLYGQGSIKFTLSANSVYDIARYNFLETIYAIKSFSVWVYLEGNATVDIILRSPISETIKSVSEQNKWVRVEIIPVNRVSSGITLMGITTEEVVTEGEMYFSTDGVTEELFNYSNDGSLEAQMFQGSSEVLDVTMAVNNAGIVEDLTIFSDDLEGSFILASDYFMVKLTSGSGNVYIDRAEVVATSNYTAVESLEKQTIKLGALFENKIHLGARPASLIDEVDKGAEQGESAFDMYKGVTKTLP